MRFTIQAALKRWPSRAILALCISFLACQMTAGQDASSTATNPSAKSENPPKKDQVKTDDSSGKTETKKDENGWFWKTKEFQNVTKAFIVGSLGAGVFFLGVFCGFITPDREQRKRQIEFLTDKDEKPKGLLTLFLLSGGFVAGVFQWAQFDVFAPIQAFVLGATWPSVVMRIMSGNGQTPPGLAAYVNAASSQIPNFPNAAAPSATSAQVVIQPKSAAPAQTQTPAAAAPPAAAAQGAAGAQSVDKPKTP